MTRLLNVLLVISLGTWGIAQAGQIIVAGPIGSNPEENAAVCYVSNLSNEYRTVNWSYIRRNGELYEEILEIDFAPYETKRLDTEDLQAALCVMEVEGGAELWRMLGCNLANIDEWCINTVEGRVAPGFKWPEPSVNQ